MDRGAQIARFVQNSLPSRKTQNWEDCSSTSRHIYRPQTQTWQNAVLGCSGYLRLQYQTGISQNVTFKATWRLGHSPSPRNAAHVSPHLEINALGVLRTFWIFLMAPRKTRSLDNLDIPVLFRNLMFCLFILFFLGVTVSTSRLRNP
jgi:hypothetical protein